MYMYVTLPGKTVHFAVFCVIALLALADSPFFTAYNDSALTSFARSVAKLQAKTFRHFPNIDFEKNAKTPNHCIIRIFPSYV